MLWHSLCQNEPKLILKATHLPWPANCMDLGMGTAISALPPSSTNPDVLPAGGIPPKPKRWLKILVSSAIILVAASGLYLYLNRAPPLAYVTMSIDRGDIDASVSTTGTMNAEVTVQVGSQVSGNIIALYADFNTRVKKGQLIAVIDPAPFQAAVDQAAATLLSVKSAHETALANVQKTLADQATADANTASQQANLTKAQSAVDVAKTITERHEELVKEGVLAKEDGDTTHSIWEQAVAGVTAARAAVAAAGTAVESARQAVQVARYQEAQALAIIAQNQAALAQAQLNLSHTKILAPVDGTVESRNMDVGQTVAASFASPVIFLIARDLTKMQVDTNVDESDVSAIRLGQTATFTVDAYASRTFTGRVIQIREAPINVLNVITYDVVIQVANDDLNLFPGMTANVTIMTSHASNVLRIPKAALRFRPRGAVPAAKPTKQDGQTIYVPGPKGEPEAVSVQTGISDANRTELKPGTLQAGVALVTGVAVKPGTATPPPASSSGSPKRLGI